MAHSENEKKGRKTITEKNFKTLEEQLDTFKNVADLAIKMASIEHSNNAVKLNALLMPTVLVLGDKLRGRDDRLLFIDVSKEWVRLYCQDLESRGLIEAYINNDTEEHPSFGFIVYKDSLSGK